MARVSFPGIAPFCYTSTNDGSLVGDGTFYPVGLTIEEFCYLYWKVRTFKFVGSSTVNIGGTDVTGSVDDCLTIIDEPLVFNPSSELDLVCDWTVDQIYLAGFSKPLDPPEAGNAFYTIGLFWGYLFPMPNLYFYNGLYWPWLYLEGWGYQSNPSTGPTPIPTKAIFLGKEVQMYKLGDTNDFSLTVTACTEWPYNP
jgi:hypothetical protein